MVQEALEGATLIAGSLTTPLSRQSPEHVIVEHSERGLALAPTQRKQHIKPYVQLFNDAGIQTDAIGDYRAMKWSKALLNMVGNATAAIVNRHPRIIYETGPTYRLERKMLEETLQVMEGLGLRVVDLPGAPAKKLVAGLRWPAVMAKGSLTRAVAEGRGNKMPSFHIDLTAGKRQNEVLYHNGAVAREGRRLGIPVPVNTALTDILLRMARREVAWERYDGNPNQLVQDVMEYAGQGAAADWDSEP
jgi:2-dehydropantoate 2-reductase